MKVVIIGAGVVGQHVARELTEEKRDVVLVEKNPEVTRTVTNELDCMVINDDGSRLDVLQKAGVEDADYFIALTGMDEVNMVTCGMVSGEFNKPKTIARVRNPYYSSLSISKRTFMGIDHIINPEIEAANTIVRTIEEGVMSDLYTVHEDKLQLRTFQVPEGSVLAEKEIKALRQELQMDFLISAVVRDEVLIVPSGDLEILPRDILYILGSPETLNHLFGTLRDAELKLQKIAIVGGTRITEYIIQALKREKGNKNRSFTNFLSSFAKLNARDITVIEKYREKAKYFSQLFPDITVLNRDAAEEGMLEEEGIMDYDLLITATEFQSLNFMTAMLGKHLGIRKTMALLINNSYAKLCDKGGVDAIVGLKSALVNSILNIVRKANIKTLHSFYEDELELVELRLAQTSKPVDKSVQDINMPKGALILFISRNGEPFIPSGSTVLRAGDQVGIIAKKDAINKLESIFENEHER